MARRRRYRSAEKTLGTSPGTLTYVGAEIEHATKIKRIEYNEAEYRVDDSSRLSACRLPNTETPFVNWLDVDGIHEPKVVAALGQQYHLHPLLLEDVMNTEQKPKIDLYDDTVVFVTLKNLHHSAHRQEIESEHVSLVLGKNYLISFQEERTKDIFDPVIERIRASSGKTRRNGADYLLYALMDLMVDNYLLITERIGEKMDELEDVIVQEKANQQTLATLYTLKRELAFIRRTVLPLRDIIGVLIRGESDLIQPATMPFLRDLADHVNQAVETLDAYREVISGLMEVYYSIVNNRMNSVMKTLTIVSAIFIPLTFIAGIYGMNFENMPELRTQSGYFWILGIMLIIAVGEIIYFKRRGWM
ncbi:magnesium/cobalt transporter CorA [Spirosoma soli]|uniref:Magnesium transport protein CorA n=1 Tax=Spirosoma soli TaxID=1770529 RepID=A0ABW5M4U2_9BACT